MTRGPSRRTITTGVFLLDEFKQDPLGKIGNVDFAERPEAENDILDAYARYKSHLASEQAAPDLRAVQKEIRRLGKSIQTTRDRIKHFLDFGSDSLSQSEFKAALSDLLREQGLSRVSMQVDFETASDDLRQAEMYLTAAAIALSAREEAGEITVASPRPIRDEFYRRLHRVLKHHGLDDGVGETSLIVQVILELEGKSPTEKSGPAATMDADADRRRRKDKAAEVKRAVNPKKGA